MQLVIPMDARQAERWARSQGLARSEWRMIRNDQDLRGIRDGRVIVLPGGYQRHDFMHLVDAARSRNMSIAYEPEP